MDATTSSVSYRPYKSKRHSRTVSGPAAEPTPTPSHANDAEPDVPHDGAGTPPSPQLRPAPVPAPATNGHTPPPSAPPSPTPSSSKLPPKPATSTFRHVAPHASSPLRPAAPSRQSLTVSPSFARQASLRRFDVPQQRSRVPSAASDVGPSTRTASPPVDTPPPSRSSSVPPARPAATPSPPPPPPPPSAPASDTHSPSLTPTPSSSAVTRRPPAPYRPGFQPRGVYRPRTDEFLAARSAVRDRGKVEQRRLERRLEKLIALHFPPAPAPAPEKPPANRRASSIFELDFSKNPATLWRDVVEARMQGAKADLRAEEQSITPWEDDAAVAQCPICTTSFHPLTNRKHHCRLCGRIVCALPPRPPTRTQTCSLLFVVDQRSGRIDEVGEGVDYGVRRKGEDDRFLRGVRICRDCRVVLRRKQYVHDANHVPTYVRLYSTLVSLEKEIEDALPQFQELVLSLATNSAPTPHTGAHAPTAAMRTRLLASFGEYDRLAKRIGQLPTPRGASQDRVQGAIMTRANLFLQKNMFPLQSLPKPRVEGKKPEEPAAPVDKDSAMAHALQPLLEQEALLETFVEEARAQRKFEDARTLKASLVEIRAEIERVSGAAAA